MGLGGRKRRERERASEVVKASMKKKLESGMCEGVCAKASSRPTTFNSI